MMSIKLLCGVGINDAEYQVSTYKTANGRQRRTWICPVYVAWKGMLTRCYNRKVQERTPTYIGCTVAPEWFNFSVFRDWALGQAWDGMQLDKDILAPGNKRYGPDTCVFVSAALNSFLNENSSVRGEWPIGVYWNKNSGKFMSHCSNPFTKKRECLGYFNDPADAYEAWRARKHQHALMYADTQTDPRIAAALRARFARTEPACRTVSE